MARKATAALTGLVAATAAVVLVTAGTSAAAGTRSSAYGLAVYAQGDEAIPPTPMVESIDGSEQMGVGTELPDNPLITGSIGLFRAGNDSASIELVDLGIGGGLTSQIPPQLKEALAPLQAACDQIPADGPELPELPELPGLPPLPLPEAPTAEDFRELCNDIFSGDIANIAEIAAIGVECEGDDGTVEVADVALLGAELPGFPAEVPANTALVPENPGLGITLNRQTQNDDGSFTVDALVVDLAGQAELVLGSVTCGEPLPTEPAVEEPDPGTPPLAPAPEPVRSNIPVTG